MTTENEGVIDASDEELFAKITSGKATEPPEAAEPVEAAIEAPKPAEPVKPEPQTEPTREDPRVPLAELMAERKNRQALERQMADLLAAINRNAPQPPAPPAPDIFESPDAFVRQQFEPEADRLYRIQMYNAKLIAEARFGDDKVSKAQAAFDEMAAQQKLHPAEFQQVMASPNPFAEAVKWYERHQIVSEVGTDPKAYREKLRSELLTDPEFRKQAMAAWQAEARSNPTRSPVINLPSLAKVGSAALPSGDQSGMSDEDLWASVTSRKR